MLKKITDFINLHRIKIIDSNKRAHKHTRTNVNLFQYHDDYNKFLNEQVAFETETLYTVEISESELERIASFEEQVFNNIRSQEHYNMFEMLLKQKEHEKYLRDKYQAVNNAYKQYSLMLHLAESGNL